VLVCAPCAVLVVCVVCRVCVGEVLYQFSSHLIQNVRVLDLEKTDTTKQGSTMHFIRKGQFKELIGPIIMGRHMWT
jgi:hypothetical protein